MSGETALLEIQQVAVHTNVAASPLMQIPEGKLYLQFALRQFSQGDWGNLSDDQWATNDERLMDGGLIIGHYAFPDDIEAAFDLVALITDMEMIDDLVIIHDQQRPIAIVMFDHDFVAWQREGE